MTRALADRLESQVATLPAPMLVALCAHLGALAMFPHRLAVALEGALAARVGELDDGELLSLLRASGRLRWRVPEVLGPLLARLVTAAHLDSLDGPALGGLLYELYRLD